MEKLGAATSDEDDVGDGCGTPVLCNGLVVRRAVSRVRQLFRRELKKDRSRIAPLSFEHLGRFLYGEQLAAIGVKDFHESKPVLGIRSPVVDG